MKKIAAILLLIIITLSLFSVGAGNTVGEDGIVSLLEKEGYSVTRISIDG